MKLKFTAISILASVVMLSGCQTTGNSADNLYNQYRGKANNKAFSIGTNGVAGAAWGATSKAQAMKLAQKTCVDSGGLNCSVTELNGTAILNQTNQDIQSNSSTVNNFNIISQGVNYKPNLSVQSSGFFINRDYILTTSDVVDSCSKINYERSGRLLETTVVRVDKANNLAVLKALTPNKSYAKISTQKQTKQGERTYTYGYDKSDMVNSKTPTYQGRITDGIISSASGQNNDVRFMKVTNEINKGNVGGPVLAENGNVIGIVSDTNKEAIKSSMFTIFLNELNIDYKAANKTKPISPAKIAEDSQKITIPLVCLNEV
ncbi:trypsin-like peptidase domain-containing protein [Aliivibrio sp. SR45-2]|uniref:trypsin-like peptidase domain-containing protein n=1 Tax=Aliivibrio sp. SR45-2 TaxID=2760931 RepID=UPI0015F8B8D9|nr:trypsin-like peptidase domain-containing protein [Aliivibrio sp. SR45-2]MBB1315611.1 trypsin-like peptidase domain-containing protein [Aliivibrio sp. SR45-2]